jgi:hypothetical protein
MNDWRAQNGATQTALTDSVDDVASYQRGATDTLFEADDRQHDQDVDASALMRLAERAVSERDALRAEVAQLRDALLHSESNQRVARGSSRELQELRDALELRDREVKRLKDSNVARERLLVDARAKLDEATHARSAALAKAETRERNAHEAESAREELKSELAQWRRRAEDAELEWHRAINAERGAIAVIEDLRTQLSESQRIAGEQLRDAERTRSYLSAELARIREAQSTHESELASERELRQSELASERELRETVLEAVKAEASGREHGLRFAFAEKLEQLAAESRDSVANLKRAHEEALAGLARQHEGASQLWEAAIAMHHARAEGTRRGSMFRVLETAEALEFETGRRVQEAQRHGDEVKQLREMHEFAIAALRAKLQREADRVKKLESDIAQERLWFERETTTTHARAAGTIAGLQFAHREAMATVVSDRDHAAVCVAQWLAKLDHELAKSRGDCAELRLLFEESDATRELLAQKVVESSLSAAAARMRCEQLTDEVDQRSRAMAKVVAELTRATVEQHAAAAALRHGRALPSMADVDASIVAVSRRVPAEIAEELWCARALIASAVFAGPGEEIEVTD